MNPKFIIVDLFCGFGGTTLGFDQAMYVDDHGNLCQLAKVIACVNHDPKAIESHWKNHPDVVHFEEDMRALNLDKLMVIVRKYQAMYPDAKLILWASLECTNYSKAKGGLPRDPDSRTLPIHLYRYIQTICPDYVMIENVVEFMAWGPMRIKYKHVHKKQVEDQYPRCDLWMMQDEKTGEEIYGWEPISKKNGQEWIRWRNTIKDMGYKDDWKQLNSADFGAYTSRNRLFGIFARPELPINWPEPTHVKNARPGKNKSYGMFSPLKKWMPVKDVLDFADEGHSIFNRQFNEKLRKQDRKDLVESTLARIYAGLIKFVAGGKEAFLAKTFSGKPEGKVIPIDGPAGTITTFGGSHALVQCSFISNYNGGEDWHRNRDLNDPLNVITASERHSLIQPQFLLKYNSMNKSGHHVPPGLEEPAPTVPCQGRLGLVSAKFMIQHHNSRPPEDMVMSTDQPARTVTCTGGNQGIVSTNFLTLHYSNGGELASVENPAPTIPSKDRMTSVTVKHFIDKQYGNGDNTQGTDQPAGTIMQNDKHALIRADHLFIQRPFGEGGGQHSSMDAPAGSLLTVPKLEIIKAEKWIMNTNYQNIGTAMTEPCSTIPASRRYPYLINPQYSNPAASTEEPCFTLIARMDKRPPRLITPLFLETERGDLGIIIYEDDSPMTKKIKEFMALYGIVDIKMRMLKVVELLQIQGFPKNYHMVGSQADQKKFIGNSVVPHVVKCWAEALGSKQETFTEQKVA
jgi:DNA (cytosine-5)-methyltransferase 1